MTQYKELKEKLNAISTDQYCDIFEGNFNSIKNCVNLFLEKINLNLSDVWVGRIIYDWDYCSMNTSFTNLSNLKKSILDNIDEFVFTKIIT